MRVSISTDGQDSTIMYNRGGNKLVQILTVYLNKNYNTFATLDYLECLEVYETLFKIAILKYCSNILYSLK